MRKGEKNAILYLPLISYKKGAVFLLSYPCEEKKEREGRGDF